LFSTAEDCLLAFDAFLYITGGQIAVEGETLDSDFSKKKAFEIKSFKIEVKNPTSMGSSGGGAGTGKCTLEPFEVTKVTDNCSPSMFKTCATGQHYTSATLSVRKAGGGGKSKSGGVYLVYTFYCVFVNSVSWSGSSGDDLPEETVQFAFGAVQVDYTPQKADGTAGTVNSQIWNQVTNTDTTTVPEPG
jgi:type VI secretion system secreted protein Hcp